MIFFCFDKIIMQELPDIAEKSRRLWRGDCVYNIINIIAMILFFLCWILIIRKIIINKCVPVKTVTAKVVDKYKPDVVSHYPGAFKPKRYIVIFETKDKKLSFDVSKFSYDTYKMNEKGTLKYKGTKIISFQ